MPLVMFSKMLQEFSVAEAAQRIKALGFDGVDLTVRPKGHVEPATVGKDLPAAIGAIHAQGLDVPMASTAITRATDPHAEATVEAAARQGIRLLKLGYWNAAKESSARRSSRRNGTSTAWNAWPSRIRSRSGSTITADPAT